MTSVFSKIISSEIPAFKVAETDKYLAFLDVRPVTRGHVLCIPKIEVDYLFDMSDEQLSELIIFSKKVALGLKQIVPCKKVGMSVVGLEVPHAHIHLIPMNEVSDMSFSKERVELSQEEFATLANEISKAISL